MPIFITFCVKKVFKVFQLMYKNNNIELAIGACSSEKLLENGAIQEKMWQGKYVRAIMIW